MVTCLIERKKKFTIKPVNYNKIKDITKKKKRIKTLPPFRGQLTKALQKYANIDPECAEGQAFLRMHCIQQVTPGIRRKL